MPPPPNDALDTPNKLAHKKLLEVQFFLQVEHPEVMPGGGVAYVANNLFAR